MCGGIGRLLGAECRCSGDNTKDGPGGPAAVVPLRVFAMKSSLFLFFFFCFYPSRGGGGVVWHKEQRSQVRFPLSVAAEN